MFKNKLCFLVGACLVAAQAVATDSPNVVTNSYPAYQLPKMFNGAPTSAQAGIRTGTLAETPVEFAGTRPMLGGVGNSYTFSVNEAALPGYIYGVGVGYDARPAPGSAWNRLGVRLYSPNQLK